MKHSFSLHIKHFLFGMFVLTALTACGGEDAKPEEGVGAPPKLTEEKPDTTVVTSAPVTQKQVTNPEPPIIHEPESTPPANPAPMLSTDQSELVNIANGKPIKQSSEGSWGAANRAVDGNVDGDFFHSSVTHTGGSESSPWLEIDLGESENIDHIVVWNRTDCCSDRLSNYWIFVSEKPFEASDTVESLRKKGGVKAVKGGVANPSLTVSLGSVKARFVRIQISSKTPQVLSLAEVEVYRAK